MKPIEEGCLAIVTRGDAKPEPSQKSNIGTSVKVGKFIGKSEHFTYNDLWEVDKPQMTNLGIIVYMQREANLMRIDGLEESATQEEQQEVKS